MPIVNTRHDRRCGTQAKCRTQKRQYYQALVDRQETLHARRESCPSRVEETIEEEATMLISARVLGHDTGWPKTRGRVTPPDSAHKLNIPTTANPRWRYAPA